MEEMMDEKEVEVVKQKESIYELTEKLSSHEYSDAVLERFKGKRVQEEEAFKEVVKTALYPWLSVKEEIVWISEAEPEWYHEYKHSSTSGNVANRMSVLRKSML